jgi:hypothetical protein
MDDPVLAMDDDLTTLAEERHRLAEAQMRLAETGECPDTIDDTFANFSKRWHPAMRQLADTPASSFDGVLVKLRTVAASMMAGRENVYDKDTLLLAIADLERLTRECACRRTLALPGPP